MYAPTKYTCFVCRHLWKRIEFAHRWNTPFSILLSHEQSFDSADKVCIYILVYKRVDLQQQHPTNLINYIPEI